MKIPEPLEELSPDEVETRRRYGHVLTRALSGLTERLTAKRFEWILPVIFSRSTDPLWPDPGASIEKRIEVEIYEQKVRATLSMIIHKLVACSLLHDKFFILSPNVRVEKRERRDTGWHLYEFTQLDFEVANASSRDVMELCEEILAGVIGDLDVDVEVEPPFITYSRESLLARYGDGWEGELPKHIGGPVWVTNIPREFYDYESDGKWDNYDLYVPRYGEIISGARREWEHSKILGKIQRDGVAKENYGLLLRLAEESRLRPSAGAGIGVERLVAWLVGAEHVGEVQAFPKVPGAVCEL